MNVLFVTLCSIEDNSSVTISNIGLINGFKLKGFNVHVLTISKSKSSNNFDDTIANINNLNVQIINNNSTYEKIVMSNNSKCKRLFVSMLRFIYHKISIYDNTINIVKNASVSGIKDNYFEYVVSTSDPKTSHLYVAKLIKKGLRYGNWIQHWGDPLSIDITNSTIYPKAFLKTIENKILCDADKIVYVSPFTYEKQKEIFPQLASKMVFAPLPYDEPLEYPKVNNQIPVFGYFGSYNTKIRNINPLLESFKMNRNIELLVIGNGDIEDPSYNNIHFEKRVNRKRVKELEKNCDCLICICNDSGTQIPGKLYYYAATNRPIIVVIDGEYKDKIREFLGSFNRYICCENSKESISQALYLVTKENTEYRPVIEFSATSVVSKILNS